MCDHVRLLEKVPWRVQVIDSARKGESDKIQMFSHAFSDMSHNGVEVLATYKKARAEYENRDAPSKEE